MDEKIKSNQKEIVPFCAELIQTVTKAAVEKATNTIMDALTQRIEDVQTKKYAMCKPFYDKIVLVSSFLSKLSHDAAKNQQLQDFAKLRPNLSFSWAWG